MTSTTSEARHQANIANAQLSTGPKTPAGKAISALNARTHGLCCKDLVIEPHEQLDFDNLQDQHMLELKPDNGIELTLFQQIVAASWNMRRIRQLETALQVGVDPLEALEDEVLQKKLDRLARHQTRHERSYYRAIKELKALQTERHNRAVMTPEYPEEFSPLVNSIEISKRTQEYQAAFREAVGGCHVDYTPIPRRTSIFHIEPKLEVSNVTETAGNDLRPAA